MLFTHVHQKSWWYDSHFLRQTEIGNYGSFFQLFPFPLKTQKIRILKKWKKLLEISFYTCVPLKITIIWGSVPEIESETDRIFCPFTPPLPPSNNPENQTLKKMKKVSDVITGVPKTKILWCMLSDIWRVTDRNLCHFGPSCLEISSFYTSVPEIMIICYTVPKIWCVTDVTAVFDFRLFFALLPL